MVVPQTNSTFDQASPNNLAVGWDRPKVTDLVIKTEADDLAGPSKDEADEEE